MGLVKDAVEIFPLEVWGEIFSYLAPEDKISCYKALREWKDLLASKRTKFMMPQAFPFISGYLKEQDLLNCRRVCRDWKNGVDDFLQAHPVHYNEMVDHDHSHFHCPYAMRAQFRPALLAKLEWYLEGGDGRPEYNPFAMSRTVVYREREPVQGQAQDVAEAERNQDQTLRLRAAFPKFLTFFGSEMWHCWLIFTDDGTTRESIYTMAQSYLTLMPNLKTLSIGVLESNFSGDPQSPEIRMLVQANPLPELKSLVKLCMDSVPNPLEDEMLYKHRRLKKLSWKSNSSCEGHEANVENEMRELEVLRLCPFTNANIAKLNLPSSASQLKVLNLFAKNQDLGSVFRAVSKFCQSLNYFGLDFFGSIPEDFNENLFLPLVETVKINSQFLNLKNIDFLMACPLLKNLEVAVASKLCENWRPDLMIPWLSLKEVEARFEISPMSDRVSGGAPNVNGVIQFYGCEDFLYGSNIWGMLPNLDLCKIFIRDDCIFDMRLNGVMFVLVTTTFERYVYTKKGYLEFLEKTRHS